MTTCCYRKLGNFEIELGHKLFSLPICHAMQQTSERNLHFLINFSWRRRGISILTGVITSVDAINLVHSSFAESQCLDQKWKKTLPTHTTIQILQRYVYKVRPLFQYAQYWTGDVSTKDAFPLQPLPVLSKRARSLGLKLSDNFELKSRHHFTPVNIVSYGLHFESRARNKH